MSRVRSITELCGCECRWSRTWLQMDPCNARVASASDTRSETAVTRLGGSRVVTPTCPVGALPRGTSPSAGAVGVTTQELPWLCEVEGGKEGACKAGTTASPRNAARGHSAALNAQQGGASAEQLALGEGWSHVVRGGVLPTLLPPLSPVIKIPLLNRSRRCPGSLNCPSPGTRPGLRSLSPNPQQPLNRLQGSKKRKKPRVTNRGH